MKKWLMSRQFWMIVGALLMLIGFMVQTPLWVPLLDSANPDGRTLNPNKAQDWQYFFFVLWIPTSIRIILGIVFLCAICLGGALMNLEGHFNERTVTYFKKKFNRIEEEFKYAKGLFYETEKRVARAKKEQERLIEDNVSSLGDLSKKKKEVSRSCREAAFWAAMNRIRNRLQNYFTEKLTIYHDEDFDDDYYAISIGSFKWHWKWCETKYRIAEIKGFSNLELDLYPTCEEQIAIVKEEMKRYKEWSKKEDGRKVNIKLTLHIKHGFSKAKEGIVETVEKQAAKTSPRPRFPYKEDSCPEHDFSKEVAKTLFGKLPVKDGIRTLYLKTLECTRCGKKKIKDEWGEYVKMELEEQF